MTALKLYSSSTLDIYSAQTETELEIPVLGIVNAGFPSPATDFIEQNIDLNRDLIKHPSATFYVRVKGESMKDAKINDGDLLIVDKSIEPCDGRIAVCSIDGEFTVKRIKKDGESLWLVPANDEFKAIQVNEENDARMWGVVIHAIKSF